MAKRETFDENDWVILKLFRVKADISDINLPLTLSGKLHQISILLNCKLYQQQIKASCKFFKIALQNMIYWFAYVGVSIWRMVGVVWGREIFVPSLLCSGCFNLLQF